MRNRNAIEILIIAVLLLAGYSLFQSLTDSKAVLLESNLQSNLARISRYLNAPRVDAVIVGSSISGRLLPSYFKDRGMEILNLGLDGCHAPCGLKIVQMRKKLPKMVLVESSALYTELIPNEETLIKAVMSPSFQMGRGIEFLRPENRPLSILYWWIKSFSDNKPGGKSHYAMNMMKEKNYPLEKTEEEKKSNDREVEVILSRLMEKGVDLRLVVIPHSEGWGIPESGRIKKISTDLGIPIVEPGIALAKTTETLKFTDGLHLDVASARMIAAQIVEALKVDQSGP